MLINLLFRINRSLPATSLFRMCLLLLLVPSAWGFGLGEMSFQSSLGEPLQASIELIVEEGGDYNQNNIKVRLVGSKEASKLGIDLIESYYAFRFDLLERDGRLYIELTSTKPISEPFVNMLLEVRWPKGSVFREYTILLDPPAVPAVTAANSQQTLPSPLSISPLSVTGPAPRVAPVSPIPLENNYRVQSGDSLSAIARRIESRGEYSAAQVMDWIFQNNPQAFIRGDRNQLMAGVRLVLPGSDQLLAARPATAPLVAADPVQPEAPVSVTTNQTAAIEPASKPVLSLDESTLADRDKPLESAPANISPAELRARINLAQESNDKLARENEQLRVQLKLLEASEYVGNLEKLISLKDQQITEFEQREAKLSKTSPIAAEVAPSIERPSLLPVAANTPADENQGGWWGFYIGIMLALIAFLVYFMRNRKSSTGYSELVPASLDANEERVMLQELDQLANQYNRDDKLVENKPEPDFEIPDFVGKATGGRKPSSAVPGQARRPDDEVMRDIERRIQGYNPSNDKKRVMPVPEKHDDIDHVVSEALTLITKGNFDTAEAILLEADFEARGKEGRLTDALEYLSYCRNAKGNRNAS